MGQRISVPYLFRVEYARLKRAGIFKTSIGSYFRFGFRALLDDGSGMIGVQGLDSGQAFLYFFHMGRVKETDMAWYGLVSVK